MMSGWMPALTIEGLVLGLLAGLLLPPALTAVLRSRLGRGVALFAASVGLTLLVVFVIGFVQDHPDAAIGAFVFAPGIQAIASAFLWRERLPVLLALLAGGVAWLLPTARFVGLA